MKIRFRVEWKQCVESVEAGVLVDHLNEQRAARGGGAIEQADRRCRCLQVGRTSSSGFQAV